MDRHQYNYWAVCNGYVYFCSCGWESSVALRYSTITRELSAHLRAVGAE